MIKQEPQINLFMVCVGGGWLFADISPTSQALCEDVVTVLTVFCEKLESVDR